ncbi:hypothetical protein [Streptomyces sp. NPDC020489]
MGGTEVTRAPHVPAAASVSAPVRATSSAQVSSGLQQAILRAVVSGETRS